MYEIADLWILRFIGCFTYQLVILFGKKLNRRPVATFLYIYNFINAEKI